MIENQARQKKVHAQVEQGAVGLFVEDFHAPHDRANDHEQKNRDDAAQDLQILVHGSC